MKKVGVVFVFFLVLSLCLSSDSAFAQQDIQERVENLNKQVFSLLRQGRYKEAVPLAKELLAISEKVVGPDHPATASFLNGLAVLYRSMGDYSKAKPLCQRALAIREKALGPDHPKTAASLNSLGRLYYSMDDYSKAEPLYQRALAIREKVLGPGHPKTVASLNNLAMLYDSMGDYSHAEPLLQRALAIREKVLGPENPATGLSLKNLAVVYRSMGDYAKAEPLLQRALAIDEKVLGPDHPDTAISLHSLAELYYSKGDYSHAEPLYQRALAIREKALGPDHPHTALCLNNLAELYKSMGDYSKAEPLLQRTLNIHEKIFGPDHPNTATSLNNLAALYSSMGGYSKAELLYQRSLAIREKALGPGHPDTAVSLNNLALFYYSMGDYSQAEPLYQRALAIKEKILGPEHSDTAISLSNLAELYKSMGNYSQAELLHKRALAIREKVIGANHPDTAVSLNNLAELYLSMGDYSQAEPLFQRSLAIQEKALGPDHPHTVGSLNNIAALYSSMGEYSKAESLYQRSLAICEKVLGPDHPDTAGSLNNLAVLYKSMGDYSKAEPLYQQSLAIRERVLGQDHPDTAISLSNLAVLYAARGDYRKAHDLINRTQEINARLIDQVLGFTSEERMVKFLATRQGELEASMSLVARHMQQDSSAKIDALNWWLRRKGIVLESQRRFQEALVYSGNPEAIKTFQELGRVRAKLSKLAFGGPGKEGPEAYQKKIAALERQIDSMEAKLIKLSQSFALQKKKTRADAKQAARALPKGSALLEFARIENYNFKARGKEKKLSPAHYLVFILHAGEGDKVGLLDLGPAEHIDQAVESLKKSMQNSRAKGKADSASRRLYDLVFAPIQKGLGASREVFISPDGRLNLIPFEVLKTPGGRYLIEDYTFNYLASGRDLIGFGKHTGQPGRSLLIGDPDFDLPVRPQGDVRSAGRRSVEMRGLKFNRLPGTLEEVMAISKTLDQADLKTGKEAIETVITMVRSPRFLHVATHGFFLSDQQFEALANNRDILPDSAKPVGKIKFENPLLRSGLALAGANETLKARDSSLSDGLLTAEEVLGLRLNGTDLVVLSACNTGLGEVKNGEGVYGLRRAFVQAGTKGLVMSMWSVPDRETMELMTSFYKNIQAGKMNRSQALRQAALDQMIVVEKRFGHTHPFYWGAFVYLGEPGQGTFIPGRAPRPTAGLTKANASDKPSPTGARSAPDQAAADIDIVQPGTVKASPPTNAPVLSAQHRSR